MGHGMRQWFGFWIDWLIVLFILVGCLMVCLLKFLVSGWLVKMSIRGMW